MKTRIPIKIYVVMGTCGEYSDRNEWPVVAFTDKHAAEERVALAGKKAAELYASFRHPWQIPEGANEFDPYMQHDDPHKPDYFLYEVDLITEKGDKDGEH